VEVKTVLWALPHIVRTHRYLLDYQHYGFQPGNRFILLLTGLDEPSRLNLAGQMLYMDGKSARIPDKKTPSGGLDSECVHRRPSNFMLGRAPSADKVYLRTLRVAVIPQKNPEGRSSDRAPTQAGTLPHSRSPRSGRDMAGDANSMVAATTHRRPCGQLPPNTNDCGGGAGGYLPAAGAGRALVRRLCHLCRICIPFLQVG
jgi:hypothetical protein